MLTITSTNHEKNKTHVQMDHVPSETKSRQNKQPSGTDEDFVQKSTASICFVFPQAFLKLACVN
jgi:hypothetical protein